ncbi:MAG: VOC family protein [Halobacteriaceae archaeon]
MDASGIDHVTLRIPDDGVADALEFYRDGLGFDIEGMDRFRIDAQGFFAVRVGPESVLHLRPTRGFEAPGGVDHVALDTGLDRETLAEHLEEAGIGVERRYKSHLGAEGRARSLFVEDPFGYRLELRATQ